MNEKPNTQEPKAPDTPEPILPPANDKRVVHILLRDLPNPAEVEDEFGNRFREKYQEENLTDLIESIKLRGLTDPPVVAKGAGDKWRIIAGHRRVAALYILAKRAVPGFTLEMSVMCLEVLGATQLALVLQSIISNELGRKLDVKERLQATKRADAAGASKKEIAAATGVGEKSVERDLRIVRDERVFKHVMDDNLPPTAASALAEVAAKQGRLKEFLDHFDIWAQLTREQIEQDDRRAKKETGKGLQPSKMVVSSRLEPHLVRGWLDALAKGKPLTEEQDLGFEATFDKQTAVASIKVKLDAKNDPVERLARAAAQMSQIAKHIAAFAQKRRELESPQGPQAALQQDESFLDVDLLKQFGLADMAEQMKQELGVADKPPFGAGPEGAREEPKEGT